MKLYSYVHRICNTDAEYSCTEWRRTVAMAARVLLHASKCCSLNLFSMIIASRVICLPSLSCNVLVYPPGASLSL
eukprot:SAG22_NODE_11494_length_481_cov_3.078534_1_plen_75_part_00